GKLFMAGILPGLLLTILFILTIIIWTTLQPELAPRAPRAGFKEKIASLSGLIETIILFAMVMGGLFLGFFTPTEAGAVGAFGTLIIAVLRKNINFKEFVQALFETTRISCMILVIVAGATVFIRGKLRGPGCASGGYIQRCASPDNSPFDRNFYSDRLPPDRTVSSRTDGLKAFF
ncbi:MAG: hypothetical protein B6I22_10355, partial [Desulfobacteraceae bacterium 4572_123]